MNITYAFIRNCIIYIFFESLKKFSKYIVTDTFYILVCHVLLLLPPANEVCEGYVFTGVCLSTGCVCVGGVWQGGVHGRGVCMVGGMHGRGCVAGGMCGRGHAWQWVGGIHGGVVHGRGHAWWEVRGRGGVHGRGGMCGMHPPPADTMR